MDGLQTKIRLKNFGLEIELRPLTVFIGDSVGKSLLLSDLWASASSDDAVFLPADRTCATDVYARLVDKYSRLTEGANLLLRDMRIELDAALWGNPVVYVKWDGRKIEAPPSIKSTAAVVLALSSSFRYVFVEDPEAHLHPSAQRLLARAVAEAVNNGKFVVITTNSDFIISEFNNLIALSNAPEEVRKKLGYRDAEIIKPEQVAAYLVKAEDGRAAVERLEADYMGIPEDEFAKVAEEILEIRNEL
jgi:predicted ATPase